MQYINYYKDMRAYFFLSDIQIVVYKAVLQYPSLNPCNTQTLVFFQGHCHSFFLSTVASLALPKTSQFFPGSTLGILDWCSLQGRLKISKSGHFISAGRCPDGLKYKVQKFKARSPKARCPKPRSPKARNPKARSPNARGPKFRWPEVQRAEVEMARSPNDQKYRWSEV